MGRRGSSSVTSLRKNPSPNFFLDKRYWQNRACRFKILPKISAPYPTFYIQRQSRETASSIHGIKMRDPKIGLLRCFKWINLIFQNCFNFSSPICLNFVFNLRPDHSQIGVSPFLSQWMLSSSRYSIIVVKVKIRYWFWNGKEVVQYDWTLRELAE